MENYITDEKNGLEYKLVGEYYLPMIKAPDVPEIGMWGCGCPVDTSAAGRSTDRAGRRDLRYLRYLKENRRAYYTALLLSGKLFYQAAEIDRTAEDLYKRITKEIALREGITEDLKARDQLAWTGAMNNVAARAREIVMSEVICQ